MVPLSTFCLPLCKATSPPGPPSGHPPRGAAPATPEIPLARVCAAPALNHSLSATDVKLFCLRQICRWAQGAERICSPPFLMLCCANLPRRKGARLSTLKKSACLASSELSSQNGLCAKRHRSSKDPGPARQGLRAHLGLYCVRVQRWVHPPRERDIQKSQY